LAEAMTLGVRTASVMYTGCRPSKNRLERDYEAASALSTSGDCKQRPAVAVEGVSTRTTAAHPPPGKAIWRSASLNPSRSLGTVELSALSGYVRFQGRSIDEVIWDDGVSGLSTNVGERSQA
jgi:hypothetical protein